MAKLTFDGLDCLSLSLEEIADLPEDVLLEMLKAEGEVVAQAQRSEISGFSQTGQLERSITVGDALKRDRAGTPSLYVYPEGVRSDGKTRSAEVGFIQEYGAPQRGLAARQWMRTANEKSAAAAVEAAAAVYDEFLKSKGL